MTVYSTTLYRILPQTFREFLLLWGYSWFALAVCSVIVGAPPAITMTMVPPIFLFILFLGAQAIDMVKNHFLDTEPLSSDFPEEEGTTVDVWALQKELMEASDQFIPKDGYYITKGSLLYFALQMEELAETGNAIANVLMKPARIITADSYPTEGVRSYIAGASSSMAGVSKLLRREIEKMPNTFRIPLTIDQGREVADGVTDVMVVASGFSLSCGFPGAACYMEVVGSNLSKKNPATGKIDKTPDGKWIKGVSYTEPNLDKVLMDYADGFEASNTEYSLKA